MYLNFSITFRTSLKLSAFSAKHRITLITTARDDSCHYCDFKMLLRVCKCTRKSKHICPYFVFLK